ncbi:MAG: hypothetical protein HQM14_17620 [SAR324 cluster bacterium]|nr:hypothetical protein [SAR324 cluster bacterium]
MKRASPKTQITHGEIEEAMKFFFARGGKVKSLPQQKISSITVIGADKWSAYESLGDLHF